MKISYKLLNSVDVSLLKDLLNVFGDAFEERETYIEAIPIEKYLESLLGKNNFIALAALEGKKVVGGLVSYVLEKFEQERKEVYLYDLAVLKDYRRQGIATGLINKLKNVSRDLGAYMIFVQADKGDTPAIGLYETFGTKEEIHHFDIPVIKFKKNERR